MQQRQKKFHKSAQKYNKEKKNLLKSAQKCNKDKNNLPKNALKYKKTKNIFKKVAVHTLQITEYLYNTNDLKNAKMCNSYFL